ncbi:adenylyl-sulfate kinase [Sporosarcina sp. P21c]|uniref:adenylyl-sulfate kinase n=1 Tax=unclassified Sporosarcina TaxID=2647733 RepID=UPI000C16CA3F|nr:MULTISPECIES: adenylyl-sulfate kinase [unclassified Sporosarcina]PIC65848.1 adenylyl-sulfate kinase [Sporosarcina sp. P16a]PIC87559.1 adenylyl-sulfate kinase [Sporosarcina sp. P21c]PIC91453.1 adenylyl-sulfate kinase [Sporosarcina sp. P25]
MAKNIVWHDQLISKEQQRSKNKHHSAVLYFTGLSGSGKSTIANAAARRLHDLGANTYVLDGDNVRHGLNKDLGFSDEARKENIRRIGEVSKLFIDSGQLVFTAFISPFQEDRDSVRLLVEEDEFVEVYISCPLEACEQRDPKGLYEKARAGVIPEFTGISSPYEAPVKPELTLETDRYTIDECVEQLIGYLRDKKWIN